MNSTPSILLALPLAVQDGMDKYRGVVEYLARHGLHWDIRLDRLDHSTNRPTIGDLPAFDGAIIDGGAPTNLVEAYARARLPLVGIDWRHPEIGRGRRRFVRIDADNAAIGKKAARTFIGVGNFASHAFLPLAKGIIWSALRGDAFASVLRHHHLPLTLLDPTKPLGGQLRQLPKPAAVFAANDIVGDLVLRACSHEGISVPSDVSVLGVDNEQIVCRHSSPPLASIQPDFQQAGHAAAAALDALLGGRETDVRRIYPVQGVVVRSSLSCPRSAGQLVQRAVSLIHDEKVYFSDINGLARLLGVSRRLLDRRFQEVLSRSVLDTITDVRLEKVCNDLKETNLSIAEICAESGLGAGTNPLRVFKRRYGMTMSDYRQRNR